MTALSFGPDTSDYQVYQGVLGAAWIVRYGSETGYNPIIGVGRDRDHALAIVHSHKAEQDRMERINPVFFLAA